uniref:Uncharacterized protein n=1 Tax=Setaria italica TaxID=4555 RepID=K3Z1H7_SETIT
MQPFSAIILRVSIACRRNPFWHKEVITVLNVISSGEQLLCIILTMSCSASSQRSTLHKPFNTVL